MAVAGSIWIPADAETNLLSVAGKYLLCGVVLFALGFLACQIVREQGKAVEKRLLRAWVAFPSVTIFRHRDSSLDESTTLCLHRQLMCLVEGTADVSRESEFGDPKEADATYRQWSEYLRVESRDSPLVLEENTNYGFRRNLLGLKPTAIAICIIGAVACSIKIAVDPPMMGAWVALVFVAAMLTIWLIRINPFWVRQAAEAYAHRLIETAGSVEK